MIRYVVLLSFLVQLTMPSAKGAKDKIYKGGEIMVSFIKHVANMEK
jgi:hypothetical protein